MSMMIKFGDLKIGMRRFPGFGVLVVIFSTVILFTTIATRTMERSSRRLADARLPHALAAENRAFQISQSEHLKNTIACFSVAGSNAGAPPERAPARRLPSPPRVSAGTAAGPDSA